MLRQRYLYEKQKWEAQQKGRVLPPALPPTVLQNEAKKPETKVADRPQAKGQPLPNEADLPKGELAVRPKAAPTTTVKPEVKVDELPQPVTPDAPRNNQPPQNQPPSNLPKLPKGVTEAVTGATTTAIGKAAVDALKTKVQQTLPSLSPDAARLPRGVPEKIDVKEAPENVLAITKQNESAKVLSKAGYDVEQLKPNSKLGVAQPDYKIEGKTFDHYAPTSSNARAIFTTLKDKIDKGQASRFVVNLDNSAVSIEKLTDQFRNWKLEGLEEIILIKGDKVTLFFPFEK